MGITADGVTCDVCGRYLIQMEDKFLPFHFEFELVDGNAPMRIVGLGCEQDCKNKLELLGKAGDVSVLPDGPLRKLLESHFNQEEE